MFGGVFDACHVQRRHEYDHRGYFKRRGHLFVECAWRIQNHEVMSLSKDINHVPNLLIADSAPLTRPRWRGHDVDAAFVLDQKLPLTRMQRRNEAGERLAALAPYFGTYVNPDPVIRYPSN